MTTKHNVYSWVDSCIRNGKLHKGHHWDEGGSENTTSKYITLAQGLV